MQQPPILTCRLAPQRAAPRAISAADARSHMIRKSRRQQRHRLLAPDADDQRHEFSSSRAADAPRVRRGRLQKIALSWAFVRANRMLRSPPPRVRFPASPPASDLTRCSSGPFPCGPGPRRLWRGFLLCNRRTVTRTCFDDHQLEQMSRIGGQRFTRVLAHSAHRSRPPPSTPTRTSRRRSHPTDAPAASTGRRHRFPCSR
jgi:hypothetical protein